MAKGILKVTKESKTGRNIEFQNIGNNEKLTNKQLISRLETGKSAYNENYYIKHENGKRFIVSKPDKTTKNNLD